MKLSFVLGCGVVRSPGSVGMVAQRGFLSSCVHFLFLLSGYRVTVYDGQSSLLPGHLKTQKPKWSDILELYFNPTFEHRLFLC